MQLPKLVFVIVLRLVNDLSLSIGILLSGVLGLLGERRVIEFSSVSTHAQYVGTNCIATEEAGLFAANSRHD